MMRTTVGIASVLLIWSISLAVGPRPGTGSDSTGGPIERDSIGGGWQGTNAGGTLEPPTTRPAFDGKVTVATFNVLNLFDEYDDPYHEDEGMRAKPRAQLERLAETIRRIDADVLALQEVENRGCLERVVRELLPDLGYEHVVCFEGNDRRGIDCAVLSRLPIGPVTSHRHLRFRDDSGEIRRFRRDLLAVSVEPVGFESFTVFVVHLKSKRGGAKQTAGLRSAEARAIRRVLDRTLSKDAAARFLICGDFNDTWDSEPMGIIRGSGPGALRGFVGDLAPGEVTYNRGRYRSVIDFVLASPELSKRYMSKSYRIRSGSVETGGSDHNPVSARFELRRGARGGDVSDSNQSRPGGR